MMKSSFKISMLFAFATLQSVRALAKKVAHNSVAPSLPYDRHLGYASYSVQ
jgi:hypothetical protein